MLPHLSSRALLALVFSTLYATTVLAAADHDSDSHDLVHSHGNELCGCEAVAPDHPFVIDCADTATIRAATTLLESETCIDPVSYDFEWAGAFNTPSSQAFVTRRRS